MKIALGQIQCEPGACDDNLEKISRFTEDAVRHGCNMIIFPELSDTGYTSAAIACKAGAWPGQAFLKVKKAAREYRIYIVCGLSEKESSGIYNSLAVFSPEGTLLGKYRKLHLFSSPRVDESSIFKPGHSPLVLTLHGYKMAFTICYDLRFPELYRQGALAGASVLINCAAWPQVRAAHWELLLRARALENLCYVLGCNRAGSDSGLDFAGRSLIVGPLGTVLAGAGGNAEQLITARLDLEKLKDARSKLPVYKSRRPDIYGNLGV